MKLEDTKRHVVELVVNCPLIVDFSEYGWRGTNINRENLIKSIMANFDVVETGFIQGDDKTIIHATDLVSDEFLQGIHKVRGHRLIDIWKEACKKFKAHEVKGLARVIEKTITKLTENKEQKVSEEKKEGFRVWGQETIYEGKERFVHFMGTEHLTQTAIVFNQNEKRIDQECTMVHEALVSLIRENSDSFISYLKARIKSVIHRSYDQEKICRDVVVSPSNWEEFVKTDPRKRGMIIDAILDETAELSTLKVKVDDKVPEPAVSENKDPNVDNPHRSPIVDYIIDQLRNGGSKKESRGTLELEETNNLREEVMKFSQDWKQKLFEILKENSDKQEEKKTLNNKVTDHLNSIFASMGVSDQYEFRYKLPDQQYSNIVIKGDPDSPVTQHLADIFNVDISKVAPVEEKPKSPDVGIIYPLEIDLGLFNNSDNPALQYPNLTEDFSDKTECNDPACPVHGNKNLKQRIVDMIIGIDPAPEGRISFFNHDLYLGKHRQQSPYDTILNNHFDPKPTATEIETTSNVVIQQKFIINDVNGEFFCEYKMVWTPIITKFMFSHDKPGKYEGRRFTHIKDLEAKLTQDEAFSQFQSLRRVVSMSPHEPRLNSFK